MRPRGLAGQRVGVGGILPRRPDCARIVGMKRTTALAASTPRTTASVEDARRLAIREAIRSALDALRERQETRRKELEELKKQLQAEKERRLEEQARRERESAEDVKIGSASKMNYSRASFGRESLEEVRRALRERREQARRAFANRVMQGVRDVYGGKAAPFYKAAGLSRSAYSKIISHPDHRPSKETVLAMAAALGMNPGDAKAFLHLAGYSLSEYVREDVIWATCFEHGVYGLDDIKSLLAEFGDVAPSGPAGSP